ncbi:GGDEF domain-containing protein [Rhizobium sp. EC-SD404]|uniref:GGDEF domain-containing protein n=1 Tax=Rhizobium sp. EC-SD404 TaxID=2038389 RepID=UPI00125C6631|nr:GGDEF domain-containing protein [Rhizobium sp. EC-SD404]VVT14649.1 GGDEF domain-containing protein [Rhizobium sp. EC-SD404]
MDTDNFTFLPPLVMLIFAGAYLLVWFYGSRVAIWWALGFFGHAVAFAGEVAFQPLGDQMRTLLVDAVFLLSYFALSQGLSAHFGQRLQMGRRIALALIGFGLVAYAIFVAESLRSELLAVDLTCGLLLLIPIARLGGWPRQMVGRVLVVLAVMTTLDFVGRSLVFAAMAPADSSFATYATSFYAYAAQVSGTLIGLSFALVGLGAVALDVLDRYRDTAETDYLTGLLNRRGFENMTLAHIDRMSEGAVILCDIDRFKRINDLYGHSAGDGVIAGFAALLKHALPPTAHAARFGGEEFVVFLPAYSKMECVRVAETIREAFGETDLSMIGIQDPVTASFGIASIRTGDRSIHAAISRADARMYVAKSTGRNRVVADDTSESVPVVPAPKVSAAA